MFIFVHSCAAPAERLEALMLAETMVSIHGEQWLIGRINLPDKEDSIPVDRLAMHVKAMVFKGIHMSQDIHFHAPPPPIVLFSPHSFVRFLLLVLQQSRVEVAVLLNELAYLKYEASKNCSSTAEPILSKQRNVAIAFSLMEKIIKLISDAAGNEGM
jgi:hypothetical protein